MKALVYNGKVVQIEATGFPVHEDLKWVDMTGISPQPEVGSSYDGQVFTPPVVIPLPTAEERKEAYVDRFAPLIAALEDKLLAKGVLRQAVKDKIAEWVHR